MMNSECCAICSREPEDMLLLECAHNLCLDCATELFAAAQQDALQCEICFVQTRLDQDTVSCLASLARAAVPTAQPASPTRHRPPLPREERGLQCSEHNEKALYYCFDCRVGTICSECILGTTHRTHQVSTLKRAAKTLAEELVGQTRLLEEARGRAEAAAEQARQRREQLLAELRDRQTKLKMVFDDMLRQVGTRYSELSADLERHSQRAIEMAEGALNAALEQAAAATATLQQSRDALQLTDPEALLKRTSQLQNQLEACKIEAIPSPQPNGLCLRQEEAVFVELESLLQRVGWEEQRASQAVVGQGMGGLQASLLGESWRYAYDAGEGELREREANQSMSRFSNIKGGSRRLELSRSMDNATNIINKLQERLRK